MSARRFRVSTSAHTAPDPAAQVSVEQQQEGSEGEFVEPPSTGLHAKLVAVAKGMSRCARSSSR